MKVKNKRCIRNLSFKQFKSAKTRNLIAVFAIALTTLLFTSLFTIALSINDGFQQSSFRQCGGWNHGSFKYLTEEQLQELKTDSLIQKWGLRRFVGRPLETPFNKSHVEVGYSDATTAHWMYCDPAHGHLPKEGTNEAATDTRVLELLGIKPELGTQFTMTFDVDGHETTQTFTLSGWWEYDEAIMASHVLIPLSRAESIYAETGLIPGQANDGMTGSWNMGVMFKSSLHIAKDVHQVLSNHGYQNENRTASDSYIAIGVNWGYSGSQLAANLDPTTIFAIAAILLLIIFTGYLIIYNVFQISIANDIRFYGLLKTIGTTPRQLMQIVRQQAMLLSLMGIPLGLLGGWLIGGALTPIVIARLNSVVNVVSTRPLIFVAAALFALFTVLISCHRPGKMAAKVSPIEAVRYTEGANQKKKVKKSDGKVSLSSMARANLGRSRGKTILTVISLSLAVVLLNLTVTFTNGFDMDKYLSQFVSTDFVLADAAYFQVGIGFSADSTLPQEVVDVVSAQGEITEGGKVYGRISWVEEFITEDYYRQSHSKWLSSEQLDCNIQRMQRSEDGGIIETAQLYGMEPFALDQLKVFDGDLSKLYEEGGRYIAAVYHDDDYGDPKKDSHWAKVGDKVTLRYVEEYEYYYVDTGEIIQELNETVTSGSRGWNQRAKIYRDVEYTVAAQVIVPRALGYRYYGDDEFVLNDKTFIQDTGTNAVMLYAFNTTEEKNAEMEAFLSDYTNNVNQQFNYESKATYMAEFESFRSMFLLLGGALSFIVGMVGILNFFNAILTGIMTRKREFAMLQSVGMLGKQLKTMLVYEGVFYTLGTGVLSLVLTIAVSPWVGGMMENVFWFFTYRFTVIPVLLLLPIFTLLGILVPLGIYGFVAKTTIVERLREIE